MNPLPPSRPRIKLLLLCLTLFLLIFLLHVLALDVATQVLLAIKATPHASHMNFLGASSVAMFLKLMTRNTPSPERIPITAGDLEHRPRSPKC